MANINITTHPTGRSPENKYFFGHKTKCLDMSRPKYHKIGKLEDFKQFHNEMYELEYNHNLVFYTCGICFRVETNDDRHAQFVRNMFTVEENGLEHTADWTILHNTDLEVPTPKIYVHLDEQVMLIAGTTFLGEIKKGVFGVISFVTPRRDALPMHCSAFTYNNTTNLMFGLSGTGKQDGIQMIETGCYAKSEGLTPETHKTIFDAVELARERDTLVIENPEAANARLSYPINCVSNAYHVPQDFNHANNIFFLTMDAEGVFPPVSKITGDTIKRFFETGYTSQMPGTEAGSEEIKPLFSPCYGSPFMPRAVKVYSELLMNKIDANDCNVYLINTGMDRDGIRFSLDFTRECVKMAINEGAPDNTDACLEILEELIDNH